MMEDPTLQEIWDVRQKIWDSCNNDLQELLSMYQTRQNRHPERIIRFEETKLMGELESAV